MDMETMLSWAQLTHFTHKVDTLENIKYDIYVTARLDISAGTVAAGPNLTGRMDPGMNTHLNRMYKKQICLYFR